MSDFQVAQELAVMSVAQFRRFKKALATLRRAGFSLPQAIHAIHNAEHNSRYRQIAEIE